MPNIKIEHLSLEYQQPLISDVNVTFLNQKISLLIGPSGSGKSTLLKLLAGQAVPEDLTKHGQIKFDDEDINMINHSQRSQWIAMLFQDPGHQFTMNTGREEIRFALENINLDPKMIHERIEWALKFSEVEHLADAPVQQLSGGEQQKMALAVIIAMDSKIILLDEPFASVDQTSRTQLLNKLKELKTKRHKTILLIDHDLSGYEQVADQVYALHDHDIITLNETQRQVRFKPFKINRQLIAQRIKSQPATKPIMTLKQFQLSAGNRKLLAIEDFNFQQNSISIIQGDNGVGKSTLFRAMTKAIPFEGQIQFQNTSIRKMKLVPYFKHVAMVFQDPETQFVKMTVKEEIQLSQEQAVKQHFSENDINNILVRLNLANHLDQVVYTLSAGQQKKLQILTMLIMGTDVLLMDEPFAGLDYQSLQVVTNLIRTTQQKYHQTLIIITHQLIGIEFLVDHLIEFKDQTLLTWGGVE